MCLFYAPGFAGAATGERMWSVFFSPCSSLSTSFSGEFFTSKLKSVFLTKFQVLWELLPIFEVHFICELNENSYIRFFHENMDKCFTTGEPLKVHRVWNEHKIYIDENFYAL